MKTDQLVADSLGQGELSTILTASKIRNDLFEFRRPGSGAPKAGIWKELTESVNSRASNLTNQVGNIARVTTAVANGDLSRKITVDVRGA